MKKLTNFPILGYKVNTGNYTFKLESGDYLNIKTPSYQYRNPHYKDKMVSLIMEIPI